VTIYNRLLQLSISRIHHWRARPYLRGEVERIEHVHHRLLALARERLLPLAELQTALGLERRVVVLRRTERLGNRGGVTRTKIETNRRTKMSEIGRKQIK
jgi:hypothetical protein